MGRTGGDACAIATWRLKRRTQRRGRNSILSSSSCLPSREQQNATMFQARRAPLCQLFRGDSTEPDSSADGLQRLCVSNRDCLIIRLSVTAAASESSKPLSYTFTDSCQSSTSAQPPTPSPTPANQSSQTPTATATRLRLHQRPPKIALADPDPVADFDNLKGHSSCSNRNSMSAKRSKTGPPAGTVNSRVCCFLLLKQLEGVVPQGGNGGRAM